MPLLFLGTEDILLMSKWLNCWNEDFEESIKRVSSWRQDTQVGSPGEVAALRTVSFISALSNAAFSSQVAGNLLISQADPQACG